jgi:hypothetical protein
MIKISRCRFQKIKSGHDEIYELEVEERENIPNREREYTRS